MVTPSIVAFASPLLFHRAGLDKTVLRSPPEPFIRSRPRQDQRRLVVNATAQQPDAGLIAEPGVTGTFSSNLFPVPLLGAYGWFLTVYDRDFAADVGPFVARFPNTNEIHFSFRPGHSPSTAEKSDSHVAFKGVAAGNLNVRSALAKFANPDAHHELRFFEQGGSEILTNRRNELHILPDDDQSRDDLWNEVAPTYRVVDNASSYRVREIYSGAGSTARDPAKFEYFGMNLFPIPRLSKYSAFVCVWRQNRFTSSVAIDKRGKDMQLRVLDALELPKDVESPSPIGKFAVKAFQGAVSDRIIAEVHKSLLQALEGSQSYKPLSTTDFRVVIGNTPNTISQNRRNELWVQLEG